MSYAVQAIWNQRLLDRFLNEIGESSEVVSWILPELLKGIYWRLYRLDSQLGKIVISLFWTIETAQTGQEFYERRHGACWLEKVEPE